MSIIFALYFTCICRLVGLLTSKYNGSVKTRYQYLEVAQTLNNFKRKPDNVARVRRIQRLMMIGSPSQIAVMEIHLAMMKMIISILIAMGIVSICRVHYMEVAVI